MLVLLMQTEGVMQIAPTIKLDIKQGMILDIQKGYRMQMGEKNPEQ